MLRFKRVIGSIMMMFTLAFTAMSYAAMPVKAEIVVDYLYASSCNSVISKNGNDIKCKSEISGTKVTKVVITQTLQKKKSSGGWSIVDAWSKNKSDFSYNYTYTNTSYGVSKGTYRVKTSAIVYSGNKSEVLTAYSSELTVK